MEADRQLSTMIRGRIRPEQKQQMEVYALANDWSLSDVLRIFIREGLERRGYNQDRPEPDPSPGPPPPPTATTPTSEPELAHV